MNWHLQQLWGGHLLTIPEHVQPTIRPIIAVHDCGIDLGHPAIADRCLPGRSFDPDASGPWPNDVTSGASHHGTLAALLAAGTSFGVAPAAQVLPVRYTGGRLRGWRESLLWAAEHAAVVLCPWVLDPRCGVAQELTGFLEEHCLHLALFVCPVGNRPHSVGFPACLPGALGVGAHTSELERAEYSGFGIGLDVLAPSHGGLRSLPAMPVYRGQGARRRGAGSRTPGGTSAAAALAAGAAARVLSTHPGLPPGQLLDLLRRSAQPTNDSVTVGRLDVAAALAAVTPSPGVTP